MVALLVVVAFAVFSLNYIAPGSVIDQLLPPGTRTRAAIALLTRENHLNEPFFAQFGWWAWRAIHLNFGTSILGSVPVTSVIAPRLPVSLFLGMYAFLLTMVFGLVSGVVAALRKDTAADRGVVGISIIGLSTPVFVGGVVLIYVFAVVVHWFPVSGTGSGFWDETWHLTLPAIALALSITAFVLKHTRASLLRVVDADYVTFARARGLSRTRVLLTYQLRNALIPVVTIAGVVLSSLIIGAVVVEDTFSVPGIGQLTVQSAAGKDAPVLQCIALLVAVIVMGANLLADLVYMIVDPQVRLVRTAK